MRSSYLSYSATAILQAVANGYRYGFDIIDLTGLPSGTVYPALRRLEDLRFVISKWEKEGVAHREQRPARKYYDLTEAGNAALAEALKRYALLERPPRPSLSKPDPSRERG